jgi:membrane dipeptidase
MCADNPGLIGLATTPAEAAALKKQGKLIAFIGVENGYPIGEDLSVVEAFARRGARYITLCHSADNQICDSSTDRRNPEDNGLSEFGRKVVAECNRLGVLADVSHMSEKSFYDSRPPPRFCPHSCRAFRHHNSRRPDGPGRKRRRPPDVLPSATQNPGPIPSGEGLKELEAGTRRRGVAAIGDGSRPAQQEYQAAMVKLRGEAAVGDIADYTST